MLSEGGYGYVWRAHQADKKDIVYAVKRMVCQGKESLDLAGRELTMMYKLPSHPNIVRFFDGEILSDAQSRTSQAVFVMEYCSGGTLFDLIKARADKQISLTEDEIVEITLQIARGLLILHSINITHRDLKVENVLLHKGVWKLCDFGSAVTDTVNLEKCDRRELQTQEEIFERYTTLQSRPPEMCDVYCREIVDTKVDAWMLGCVVFSMCFAQHPFWEAQKTGIVSASFRFKSPSQFSEKMHDLIRNLLTASPKLRPSIADIIPMLENWSKLRSVPLNEQAKNKKNEEEVFAERNSLFKAAEAKREAARQMKEQKRKPLDDWGDFQVASIEEQKQEQTSSTEVTNDIFDSFKTSDEETQQSKEMLSGHFDFNSIADKSTVNIPTDPLEFL